MGLLKPFAGGSSPRSTYLSARIRSTSDCFSAGMPGATTIVSEALLLEFSPVTAMSGGLLCWETAGNALNSELAVGIADGGAVLRPRAPMARLFGIAPSAPIGVPTEGFCMCED